MYSTVQSNESESLSKIHFRPFVAIVGSCVFVLGKRYKCVTRGASSKEDTRVSLRRCKSRIKAMPHSASPATRLGAELKARILPQSGGTLAQHKSSHFWLEQGGENRWSSLRFYRRRDDPYLRSEPRGRMLCAPESWEMHECPFLLPRNKGDLPRLPTDLQVFSSLCSSKFRCSRLVVVSPGDQGCSSASHFSFVTFLTPIHLHLVHEDIPESRQAG